MSKADKIRTLARDGLSIPEIAARLGIRYQHAYNVLKRSGQPSTARLIKPTSDKQIPRAPSPKPKLSVTELVNCGFAMSGHWILSETGDVTVDRTLPKEVGVYAFALEGEVVYIGVATMGLAKRLYFYAKPGATQRTSKRLNEVIKNELCRVRFIEIYTAMPADLEWRGLPIHGSAGLELGLIKKYALPWNMRSAGQR